MKALSFILPADQMKDHMIALASISHVATIVFLTACALAPQATEKMAILPQYRKVIAAMIHENSEVSTEPANNVSSIRVTSNRNVVHGKRVSITKV
jgi:hypothetical protein